jgi:hypothetical protein
MPPLEGHSLDLATCVIVLLIAGFITFALRIYVRIQLGNWGWDDWSIAVSAPLFAALSAACLGGSLHGVGAHEATLSEDQKKTGKMVSPFQAKVLWSGTVLIDIDSTSFYSKSSGWCQSTHDVRSRCAECTPGACQSYPSSSAFHSCWRESLDRSKSIYTASLPCRFYLQSWIWLPSSTLSSNAIQSRKFWASLDIFPEPKVLTTAAQDLLGTQRSQVATVKIPLSSRTSIMPQPLCTSFKYRTLIELH